MDDTSSIEASSPGKVYTRLNSEQKLDRKRILLRMQQKLIRKIEQALWDQFKQLSKLTQADVEEASKLIDADLIYEETVKLLQQYSETFSQDSLIYFKNDSATLLNLFRLHSLHHAA